MEVDVGYPPGLYLCTPTPPPVEIALWYFNLQIRLYYSIVYRNILLTDR